MQGKHVDKNDSNKKDDEKDAMGDQEEEKDGIKKEDDEERETGWDRRERFDSTNSRGRDLRGKLRKDDRRDEDGKKEQGEKQVKSALGKTYSENQVKDCGK